MTTAYAPDLAPQLEPKVVHWQPTHPSGSARPHLLSADGAAVALVALGALALGVAAIGMLTVGRRHERRGGLRLAGIRRRVDRLRLRRRPF